MANRIPDWHALSELFAGHALQGYGYRWMAQRLKELRLSQKEILTILDEEVAPALQANLLHNPTPVMNGWSEEDIKRLVTEYVVKKPTTLERIVPARLLLKQRCKYISDEPSRLSAELDKCS
ncbi:DUF7079 family protein [Pseudescherichia vulneris]|uniref:DUF7079 family protein n=1 Tax=Pseudescherichia vulneris TaxID=566 RepID=UPI003CC90B74